MRVYASVCLCVTQMAIQYAKKGVVGKGGGGAVGSRGGKDMS